MRVFVTIKLESFTVDLRFDRYVKLGDFNAIILDLIRRVCVFYSFTFAIRCRKDVCNEELVFGSDVHRRVYL